jgi:hypothetical protein
MLGLQFHQSQDRSIALGLQEQRMNDIKALTLPCLPHLYIDHHHQSLSPSPIFRLISIGFWSNYGTGQPIL